MHNAVGEGSSSVATDDNRTIDDVWTTAVNNLVADGLATAQQRSFLRLIKLLAVVEDNVFLAAR